MKEGIISKANAHNRDTREILEMFRHFNSAFRDLVAN